VYFHVFVCNVLCVWVSVCVFFLCFCVYFVFVYVYFWVVLGVLMYMCL